MQFKTVPDYLSTVITKLAKDFPVSIVYYHFKCILLKLRFFFRIATSESIADDAHLFTKPITLS